MLTAETLSRLHEVLPKHLNEGQVAQAQTLFYKRLSLLAHEFYKGKMQTLPRCGIWGREWFNVWYTPGVSSISTTIRDDNDRSFDISSRGNTVAVVSDSTRVLGDGDCTPPGGLGVMEGKALLMKMLAGIDAVPLCMDSRNAKGQPEAQRIIDFVKMVQPSFGAINLEDISQPNCYRVLDELRDACDIPVWHDDAQGTGCVILAGLINALRLSEKKMSEVRAVILGAGASNSTLARLLIQDGANPENLILFDTKGALHRGRKDIEADPAYYPKWELCKVTNPKKIETKEEAFAGADILVAASTPVPGTVKSEWIRRMAKKSIVFACANPVPEIYPYAAKEAGAFIVGTGRGDFPNQVNNSICFPGILKAALLVHAKKISDSMALCCAHTIADYAQRQGLRPDKIMPTMDEAALYAEEAAEVGEAAIREGLARLVRTKEEIRSITAADIQATKKALVSLVEAGLIQVPPEKLFQEALAWTLDKLN